MGTLTDSLSLAARAMDAQRLALEVTGHNIANINTKGYARRITEFQSLPPVLPDSAGTGVEVRSIRALRDLFVERRVLIALPSEAREQTIADSLSIIESQIGRPGESVDGALTAFFDSFATLASDPTSSAARQSAVAFGQSLAATFRNLSATLSGARLDADRVARDAVEAINQLTSQIADLNGSIAQTLDEQTRAFFVDKQRAALDELAELVDLTTMQREDGGLDVTFGNGRSLVIGANAHALTTAAGANGMVDIQSDGATVTTEITSGRLGGALHVRDVQVPDYLSRLDTIAFEVVEEVNTLHDAGFDLDGNDAGVFFTPLGSTGGAAAAIAVDPTLAADPRLVAAAGVASPGDNQTARSIADLRDALVLDGGLSTLHDGFASFARQVGSDARAAQTAQATARDQVTQVKNLRDAASGVSLDEEAVMMLKFQRAFEASARFFAVIDELSELVIETMG